MPRAAPSTMSFNGKMIGGFALVACPARYGISGIMTFIVNQDGQVYEKNLGRNTTASAEAMKVFDPNNTWRKVEPQADSPSQTPSLDPCHRYGRRQSAAAASHKFPLLLRLTNRGK